MQVVVVGGEDSRTGRNSEQQGEDNVAQVKRFELIQEIGAKVDLTV